MKNKEIKIFEAFSGIGAQAKALKKLKDKKKITGYKILGTSDWDIYANICYGVIHHNISAEIVEKDKTPLKEVRSFLGGKTISLNGNDPYDPKKLDELDAKLLYHSMKKANNIGSIVDSFEKYKRKVNEIPDVFTYSFPCQDLSSAGSLHGYNKGVKGDRSGLLYEIEKMLGKMKYDKRPKTLLMENVHNLTNKRNIKDFEAWIEKLKDLGYTTFYSTIDSHEHIGSVQRRKRVFALSILDSKVEEGKKLLELIKKYIPVYENNKITNYIKFKKTKENNKFMMRNTPSRRKMLQDSFEIKKTDKYTRTITKKQDRWPNAGWIDYDNGGDRRYLNSRFITAKESLKLMEFEDEDYDKIHKVLMEVADRNGKKTESFVQTTIYKVAGNSIIVGVLEAIFEFVYKEIL